MFTLVDLVSLSTGNHRYLRPDCGLVPVLHHELLHPLRPPHHPLHLLSHLGHEAGQVGVLLPHLAQGPRHLRLQLENIVVQPLRCQITAALKTEIIILITESGNMSLLCFEEELLSLLHPGV